MTIKGSLTTKKLIKWVNQKFVDFEIKDYEVTEISRTYYTENDYECGAARLIVYFKHKETENSELHNNGYFLCFYTIKELENYIKNGYELILKDAGRFGLMTNLEIDVRKSKNNHS